LSEVCTTFDFWHGVCSKQCQGPTSPGFVAAAKTRPALRPSRPIWILFGFQPLMATMELLTASRILAELLEFATNFHMTLLHGGRLTWATQPQLVAERSGADLIAASLALTASRSGWAAAALRTTQQATPSTTPPPRLSTECPHTPTASTVSQAGDISGSS
jgi:hypothetical protein